MAHTSDIEEAYQRGFELRCIGRYREARLEFEKVLASNPTHRDSLWQIGLIEGFEGNYDDSLSTLTELSNLYPDHQDIRYDLAMTQMMLGMIDEAGENFNEVLRQNPTHEKALRQIVYFK